MKTQKYLPGTQLSGKILDTKVEDFSTERGPGVKFVVLIKDVWKDKDGNKQESEPYYANCIAYGEKLVRQVKDIVLQKQMAVVRVLPKLEKWTDNNTKLEKSTVRYKATWVEGWYYESGSWICSQDEQPVGDLPF
jgi:single-stranded DNA-binding protein